MAKYKKHLSNYLILIIFLLLVLNLVFRLEIIFIILCLAVLSGLLLISKVYLNEYDRYLELKEQVFREDIINKDLENKYNLNKLELKNLDKENKILFDEFSKINEVFYEVLNRSNQIVYIKDEDLKFQFINDTFLKYFDIEKESVIGKTSKIFKRFGYADKDYNKGHIENIKLLDGLENEILSNVNLDFFNSDKKIFRKKKISFIYNNKKYILGVLKDITVEVSNEKRYDRIITDLREKIIEKDKVINTFKSIISILDNISIATEEDFELLISEIFNVSMRLIEQTDYGSVYIFEEGKVKYLAANGYDIKKLNSLEIEASRFKKDLIPVSKVRINITEDKSDLFAPDKGLNTDKIKESIRIPLMNKDEYIGSMSFDIDKNNENSFDDSSIEFMNIITKLLNIVISVVIGGVDEKIYEHNMIKALLSMLEMHDEYTNNHSEDVAKLSRKLGMKLELPKKDIERLYWAAITHDIGKIEVPSKVLNKKERLTNEEFEKIKLHPVTGYKALANLESLKDISKYVLHHHERYDGSGYPDGLKGNEIPFISRILTVVDSWDAMTSERAYRKPLSLERGISELVKNSDSQFDGQIVDHFIDLLYELGIISEDLYKRSGEL